MKIGAPTSPPDSGNSSSPAALSCMMEMMRLAGALFVLALAAGCRPKAVPEETAMKMKAPANEPFVLSEAEWKKRLTPDRYAVMREKGTEPAFTQELGNLFRCLPC